MVGIIDAALAMQNAVVAAQAAGLGSCCVGYARTANPEKIAEILKLPEGTFVVCALTLGIPRESPDVKPKQPLSLVIHHNHYRTDDMAPEPNNTTKPYPNIIDTAAERPPKTTGAPIF